MFLIKEIERVLFASKADKKHFENVKVLFACEEEPDYYDVEEFIYEIRVPEIARKLRSTFGDGFVSYTEKAPDEDYPTFNVEIDQNSQGFVETRTYEYEVLEIVCHKNLKEVF